MAKQEPSNNKLKTCTLYVDGMHCASCEVLIEKKLLKQKAIESVNASLKNHKVDIYYSEKMPELSELNANFADLGYSFSTQKPRRSDVPLLQLKNGELKINPDKLTGSLKLAAIALALLIAFFTFESLNLGAQVSVDSSSSLPAFFLLGLAAGVSSCAALIGGLLLSMVKQWNELYIDSDSKLEKATPHSMFHLGRLMSFTILGGILGLIGEKINLNNANLFAVLTIGVSIVMLIMALQMLGVEWAQKFNFSAPKSLTRFTAHESNFQGRYMPFLVGALTFLLPCGFTLIAQTIALTSGSFTQGALIMLAFALGTLPTLLAISFGGIALNSKPHLTAKFNIVAGLLIVFFAIYNINGQMNVLGYPSLSDLTTAVNSSSSAIPLEIATDEQGVQLLMVTAKGFEYIPTSSMTVNANTPTKLIVDNKGIQGCGAYIAANGLIKDYVQLSSGITEIDLGKPAAGTYKLTCAMGMVRPVTIKFI